MNASLPTLLRRMLAVPRLTMVVIVAVAVVAAVAVLITGLGDLWLRLDPLAKVVSAAITVIVAVPLLDWLVLIIIASIDSRQARAYDRQEPDRKF